MSANDDANTTGLTTESATLAGELFGEGVGAQAGPPTTLAAAAAWLRLPLQFPMIASGIRLAKGEG